MGILDDLKNKVERLGERAREGFDEARDKAGDLVDDAKERLGHHDEDGSPLTESGDVGPDTTSTDAVQPGYVTAEDDVDDPESGEDSLDDDASDSADPDDAEREEEALVTEPAAPSDVVTPAAAELDPVDLDATETDAGETDAGGDEPTDPVAAPEPPPAVEIDVDPYEEPLTETIGDEIAAAQVDSEALAAAVDDPSTTRDPSA